LIRRSIIFAKKMDARVKPAHDEEKGVWLFEIVSAQ
jgi:hypothetical protein